LGPKQNFLLEVNPMKISRRRMLAGVPALPLAMAAGVSAAGAVMQDDKVRVSAAMVSHPPVTPALAYRFDFKDRSIAFSGDTAPSQAVAQIAKGADVLVHEAMYVPAVEQFAKEQIAKGQPIKFDDFMAHMKADHTPVETVGAHRS
jgi:ribonuclease BN (tRNA processing enzyme)